MSAQLSASGTDPVRNAAHRAGGGVSATIRNRDGRYPQPAGRRRARLPATNSQPQPAVSATRVARRRAAAGPPAVASALAAPVAAAAADPAAATHGGARAVGPALPPRPASTAATSPVRRPTLARPRIPAASRSPARRVVPSARGTAIVSTTGTDAVAAACANAGAVGRHRVCRLGTIEESSQVPSGSPCHHAQTRRSRGRGTCLG